MRTREGAGEEEDEGVGGSGGWRRSEVIEGAGVDGIGKNHEIDVLTDDEGASHHHVAVPQVPFLVILHTPHTPRSAACARECGNRSVAAWISSRLHHLHEGPQRDTVHNKRIHKPRQTPQDHARSTSGCK